MSSNNNDATPTTKQLVSDWFLTVLGRLAQEFPLHKLCDGDGDRFEDAVFDIEEEAGLGGASRFICASFLESCVKQLELHAILNEFFPWYGLGQDPREEDRLSAICRLLCQQVLIRALTAQELFRMDLEDAVADKGNFPVLQTHYSNDLGLPLSFLPLQSALLLDEPPKFGSIDQEVFDVDSDDMVVRVFISHRWESPSNPTLDGDWRRLRMCLLELVENANLAHIVLRKNGFPTKEAIHEAQSIGFKRFFGQWLVFGMEWPEYLLDDLGYRSTEERQTLVSSFAGDMASHMFYLCCSLWITHPYETKLDVTLKMVEKILLWYDYCSLPQNPDRTPQQHDLFKKSLAKLPQIQQSMHSLSLNTDTSYFQRAWCVSEWMNAQHGSMFDYDFGGDDVVDEAAASAFRWLKIGQSAVALIQPCLPPSNILSSLGLHFTNEKHSDNATTICWILLEVLVRRSYLYFAAGWDDSIFQGKDLLIGFGALQAIHGWLQLWRDVVCHREIDRNDWVERRFAMAFNGVEDLQKRPRIDIAVSGEDSYDASNLLEAIDMGLSELARAQAENNIAEAALYFVKKED